MDDGRRAVAEIAARDGRIACSRGGSGRRQDQEQGRREAIRDRERSVTISVDEDADRAD
ncbi:MAG TPA: hypothetical protein VLS89_21285 [Candidatus Nanopelagicales bacterium]|nr:hypothetical protein [Candidatus Nanopelagicales bacterium]